MNQKRDHISSRVSFSLPQTDPPETFPRNDSLPLRKWKNGDILLTGNWNGPLTKGKNNLSPCTVYIRKWIGGPVAILGKSSVRLLGSDWIGWYPTRAYFSRFVSHTPKTVGDLDWLFFFVRFCAEAKMAAMHVHTCVWDGRYNMSCRTHTKKNNLA